MARKRTIEPGIWESSTFERLPCGNARLLWVGLISQADDDGRLRGSPELLRSIIFRFDKKVKTAHVEEWLQLLQANGNIIRYSIEANQFIELTNWGKYQKLKYKSASQFPPSTDPKASVLKPRGEVLAQYWPSTIPPVLSCLVLSNSVQSCSVQTEGPAAFDGTVLDPPEGKRVSVEGLEETREWCRTVLGGLVPIVLAAWVIEYGAGEVRKAIEAGLRKGKTTDAYIWGILRGRANERAAGRDPDAQSKQYQGRPPRQEPTAEDYQIPKGDKP